MGEHRRRFFCSSKKVKEENGKSSDVISMI